MNKLLAGCSQLFLFRFQAQGILALIAMMLTTKQVAHRLGVTTRTIYEWVKAGRLKARKLGYRTLRFRLADIVKFEEGRG